MYRFLIILSALALVASPALALVAPPTAQLRTNLLLVKPPKGWVVDTFNTTIVNDLVEFTPPGQTGGAYVDMLGYTETQVPMAARLANPQKIPDGAALTQKGQCRVSEMRRAAPDHPLAGWVYYQLFCIDRTGAKPGTVEMSFFMSRISGDSLFSVWRGWRGTAEQWQAMARKTTGKDLQLLAGAGAAATFSGPALDAATPGLLAAFSRDIGAPEICDLADGEICAGLKAPANLAPSTIAVISIAGTHSMSLRQTIAAAPAPASPYQEAALQNLKAFAEKKDVPDFNTLQTLTLHDHDWATGAGVGDAVYQALIGERSGGASIVVNDIAPVAGPVMRTRMQAYAVFLSHFLWKLGIAPERMSVVLTSPGH